ncbi:hypothetical protein TR631_12655 [Streptomyces rochei]|uniref:hypothetical protein n=1 Tax=Streptomyces rochei TaxID=1928 RepID=UPI002ACEAAF3|nr:hypothetical protein [Streptomyces rochei]WQC12619.1 hypothetical protein TR631_12655 [Streptomyces rochei]
MTTDLNLPPMPGDADPVIIPGLRKALGIDTDPDFQASIDGGFTETFEDFCRRITKGADPKPETDIAALAKITRLKRRIAELEQEIAAAQAGMRTQ